MNEEDEDWWGWSGVAGGAWAGVVCLVVVVGSVVNLAVLVHWFTTRPVQESPSAALPFVDLLVCALAAPLRYSAHAPSTKKLAEKEAQPPLVATATPEPWENETLIFPEVQEEELLEIENTSYFVIQNSITEVEKKTPLAAETSGDAIHAIVVFICLASLHVVVMVAVHRLALLLRCSPSIPLPMRMAQPFFVILVALATAGSLVGSLHSTGNFTSQLPLLGLTEHFSANNSPPSIIVVGFLLYIAGLCGVTTFCYGAIITTLLYQGRDRSVTNTQSRHDPHSPSCSTPSNVAPPPHHEEEAAVQAYGGQGKSLRACLTVISVLVTLAVCWAIPVSLALYALLTEAQIMPSLPYSDVLLLLSGLIHPFIYGEGWIAMATCYSGMRHALSAAAYKMGITKRTRTPVHSTNVDRIREHGRGRLNGLCCCPCRTTSRIPDTQLFSEVATFVNSFPLRQALSRFDPEHL